MRSFDYKKHLGRNKFGYAPYYSPDDYRRKRKSFDKKLKKRLKRLKKKKRIRRFKNNQRKGLKYSRGLRTLATKAEKILKQEFFKRNYNFKFQGYFHDADNLYIPDFILFTDTKRLVVEIDGNSHKYRKDYDNKRDEWLRTKRNCIVLRFTNYQVFNDIDYVVDKIASYKPKLRNSNGITEEEYREFRLMLELENP